MGNYVLLYHGGGMPEGEAEQQKVMAAWGAWFDQMDEAVVDGSNPVSAAGPSSPTAQPPRAAVRTPRPATA
jgi:hypothetical protein